MSIRLTITQRDQLGTTQEPRRETFDLDTILLGRDPTCHVVLTPSAVSRSHARISQEGGVFYIEDTGSSFGTRINNELLPQGEKRRLYSRDVIAIAQFDLLFETIASIPTGTWVSSGPSNNRLPVIVCENPYLRIMNGPQESTRLELEEGHEYVIGRTSEAHILLNTDLVSRKHAKLRRDLAGTHVVDLGSRNGIRLNRRPISSATLSDGDELEIGGIKMLYVDLNEMKDSPLSFPEAKTPPSETPQTPPAPPPKAQEPPPPPEKKEAKPEEKAPEPPPEEPPPQMPPDGEGDELSDEPAEPRPPMPLLKGKQLYVLLAVCGGVAIIALIFLILVLVGA